LSDASTVTVIIPARNEEADIERCLRAVLAQDHPHDRMEIVVIDGGSTDRTAEIARQVLSEGDVDWKIIDNLVGTTPSNLNTGLAAAEGDVVCRVDARSVIPPHYVRRCASTLSSRSEVVVVGGAQVAEAWGPSLQERAIARTLNNRLVMGGARYRSGAGSGPDETVYLGSFRTPQLVAAGGWDERLLTNQDFDLNRRLGRTGLVWFDASIPVRYRPRATLTMLARQYHRFGRAKVDYWTSADDAPLARQRRLLIGSAIVSITVATACILSPSHLRAVTFVCASGIVAGAVIDQIGQPHEPAGVGERMVAIAAQGAVSLGWVTGVIAGAVDATLAGRAP